MRKVTLKQRSRLLVLATFGLVLAVVPRLATQPSTAPEMVSRPEYGRPVNNGYPSLARGSDGTLWLAWISRRSRDPRHYGGDADLVLYDHIFLKRRDGSGWSREVRASTDLAIHSDPAVAAGGEGAWLVWSRRRNGRFEVLARHAGANLQMNEPVVLGSGTGTHSAPRAAAGSGGTVWAAWECFENGRSAICAASAQSGTWSAAEPISGEGNAYRPAVAVSDTGVVSVVWDGGPGERYGVYLRQQSAGQWSGIRRVPSPENLDAYAARVASAGGSRAWICYAHNPEPAAEWGIRGTRPGRGSRPSTWAVLWTGQGWQAAPGAGGKAAGFVADNADMPEIVGDGRGRAQLILTRLKSHLNFRLWESHLGTSGWSEPRQLDVNEEEYQHIPFPGGMKARIDQRPAAVAADGRTVLAYERGTGWSKDRQIATREIDGPPGAVPDAGLVRLEAWDPAPYRTKREVLSAGEYQVAFGDIHTHLLMDDGWTGTADQFYAFSRDRRGLDFAAYTPHAESNKLLASEVALVQRIAAQFNQPGRFVGIPGWEWTQGDFVVPQEGHKHILNEKDADPFFSSTEGDSDNSRELTRLMKQTSGIMFAHHIARGFTGGTNFDTIDPSVEPAIEIASHWGRFEFFRNPGHTRDENSGSSVQDAWLRGLKLGVVGGSDNHDLFMERVSALTAVLVKDLDRRSIFEALRSRRCYATTGEKIVLDVRVNGAPMGSVIQSASAPVVSVKAVGTDVIEKIEVIKFWKSAPYPFPTAYAVAPGARQAAFEWKDLGYNGDAAYYVRLTQRADPRVVNKKAFGNATSFPNEMAWSSPVWVERR